MDDTFALRRRIKHLQDQVADLAAERDIARFGQQYAATELARVNALTHDPADLPAELVHALRSRAPRQFQGVRVTAAGHDLHVLVDGAPHSIDLGAEDKVWAWIADHASTPPTHPFQREDMPDRLYGVAWGTGQLAISTALRGQDVITAYRGLKPQRSRLVRTLGMLLIPCNGAGRAVAAALCDAQGAVSAAASAATATATSAATATVGSALPAVTAAAISCTAVTSCAAPGSVVAPQPPAHVHVIGHGTPAAAEAEQPQPRRRARLKPPPGKTEEETTASERVSAPRPTPASPPGTDVPAESPTPTAPPSTAPALDDGALPSPTPTTPAQISPAPPGPAQNPTPLEPAPGSDTGRPADDESPLFDLPEPEQPPLPVSEPASAQLPGLFLYP